MHSALQAKTPVLRRTAVILAACAALSACSSIVDGTTQEIAVATEPSGSDCALERQGFVIARVNPTPGMAKVDKTKHDITIKCTKDGFHEAVYFNKSDIAGATFGNIILGGGIGWAIDSAAGADNKYTTPASVTLAPLDQPDPGPQYSPRDDATDAEGEESADSATLTS